MGSMFSKPKMPKTQMPSPEVPAVPQTESAEDLSKMLKMRSGRGRTVMTGELEPVDIGKKKLLG